MAASTGAWERSPTKATPSPAPFWISGRIDTWRPGGPRPLGCHGLGKGDGPRKWKNGKVQHVLICLKLNVGVSKVSSLLKPARGEDSIIQHCQKMEICLMCPQNEESDE